MDCGDGVTVNLSRHSDHRNSYNGSILTTDRPMLSLDMPANGHTEPGNASINDGNKTEDVTPTGNVQVTLLHPRSCEMLAEMQNSIHSVASSNSSGYNGTLNTIDSNHSSQSTFEKKENSSSNNEATDAILDTPSIDDLVPRLKSAMQSPVQPSDTEQKSNINISNKQPKACSASIQQHVESISCGIEESTEVLLVNSSECDEKYFGSGRAYSGTDSDVEVLMSEEIVESDWSAGGTATDEMAQTPDDAPGALTVGKLSKLILEVKENCQNQSQLISSELVKEDSTDQEISVEDLSSNGANDQLSKEQLLKIIGEQASYIQKLEITIDRYCRTHQTLVSHVEALRLALNEPDFNDFDELGSQK